jgi:hypothetical protein
LADNRVKQGEIMRYLTKSRFALALECPTKLEYKDDPAFANTKLENDFLMALAEGGHQVGALAKCLFPEGIEIDAVGHDAQVAQTQVLLERDEVTLFEAAIRVGRLFIRADLLRKSGDVIELYEVKAKGYDPADPKILGRKGGFLADMKPYLYDVAFQRYVLRKAFPGMLVRSHLVMPNKSVICNEAGLAQRLRINKDRGRVSIEIDPSLADGALAHQILCVVPLDDHLDQLEALPLEMGSWTTAFGEGIEDLARRLDVEPYAPRPGSQCKSCEFRATPEDLVAGKVDGRAKCLVSAYQLTATQAVNGTVFDLYASRKTEALLEERKILLVDLEPEDLKLEESENEITLSNRQWLQTEEARGSVTGSVMRLLPLHVAVRGLTYPIHFIDFETSRPALPFHAGRRPYEQLLFQFSHHRLDVDGSLRHETQHLSDSQTELPNFETVRALKQALDADHGSVLHWWDHERTVLGEIKKQLGVLTEDDVHDREELIAFIDSLLGTKEAPGRLFDLGRLVHRTAFFPGTRGSSSLKKVLPALLASSAQLQARFASPMYGTADGIPSLNFDSQAWVQFDADGAVIDPYKLLGERSEDPDLAGLEQLEDDETAVADGGAAMVAYGLLQSGLLDEATRQRLRTQLLRYCELDTLAMVMAWEGLNEVLEASKACSAV